MSQVFTIRITLLDVAPAVWRRVTVPGSMKLSVLNAVVVRAMGWSGYHLYEFEAAGQAFGPVSDEYENDVLDAGQHTLADIATVGGRFTHQYDLGDGWEHRVDVESVSEVGGKPRAACIAGENACPPEDVGGPYGYEDFLAAIRDPRHERHEDMLEWIGGPFDPTAFNLVETSAVVSRVTRPIRQF